MRRACQDKTRKALSGGKHLYETILENMTKAILDGDIPQGSRLRSIQQVQADYGVSKNVVIRCFEELKKRGLVVTRGAAGTYVAKDAPKLASREMFRGSIYAVFGPDPMNDVYHSSLLLGLYSGLAESGWLVKVRWTSRDRSKIDAVFDEFSKFRATGAIFESGPDFRMAELLREMKIPVVLCSTPPSAALLSGQCNMIQCPLEAMSYLATCHLVRKGHRNIGVIGADMAENSHTRGWRNALLETGCVPDPALLAGCTLDGMDIYSKTKALLQKTPQISALYISDDHYIMPVITAVVEAGRRIPEDVSLITIANKAYPLVWNKPLTTIMVDSHEIGQKAAEVLNMMINREIGGGQIKIVNPVLVEGQTVRSI